MPTARRSRVRRGGRVAAIAATTGVATLLAAGASPAAAEECGADAIAQPAIDHVNSAHLERSPLQQVNDLLRVDSYVLAHTVLVESLLAPVLPTVDGVLDPAVQHVEAAHLERSPLQQARDLVDVDDYVLAHTVLVESMIKPLYEGCADSGQAAPAAPMPGHAMPAPQPAPAPAPAPAVPTIPPAAVEIHGFAFAPKTLTVPAGTTVTWTNHDGETHNVTGSGMKSKSFGTNGSYSFTFASAGTFPYVCSLHPQMKGTVAVR